MIWFILRRVLVSVPILLLVVLVTFALMRGAGGTPFKPPEGFMGVPHSLELRLRAFYNLDSPWVVEYLTYVKHIFTFQFGPSLTNRYVTVDDVMRQSFPVTLQLVLMAAALSVPLGIGLGVFAAVRRGTLADVLATSTASVLLVVPVFFVAYLLATYPGLRWHLVPLGWDSWTARILPTISLSLAPTGYIARLIRTEVVETLNEDYVRTARAKGLYLERILWVHVVRNSLVPFLSAAMPMLALLITGALFVETFFGIPGVATSFLDASRSRDYPLLLGLTAGLAAVVLAANLVADIVMALIDPRIREAGGT